MQTATTLFCGFLRKQSNTFLISFHVPNLDTSKMDFTHAAGITLISEIENCR